MGQTYSLGAKELNDHWVAYAAQNDNCSLGNEMLEGLDAKVCVLEEVECGMV